MTPREDTQRVEAENDSELYLATAITIALGGGGISIHNRGLLHRAIAELSGGSLSAMRQEFRDDVLGNVLPALEARQFPPSAPFHEQRNAHVRNLSKALRDAAGKLEKSS